MVEFSDGGRARAGARARTRARARARARAKDWEQAWLVSRASGQSLDLWPVPPQLKQQIGFASELVRVRTRVRARVRTRVRVG